MTDQKSAGPPPPVTHAWDAPPTYTQGQPPSYQPQSNIVFAQSMGPQPGATHHYRSSPAVIACQFCNATVTTSVTYETGLLTWASAGIVCLVGGWLGCCLIPFCINSTKDAVHTCPNCKQVVGKQLQLR